MELLTESEEILRLAHSVRSLRMTEGNGVEKSSSNAGFCRRAK